MDYDRQEGLSRFAGRKMMVLLHVILVWGCVVVSSTSVNTLTGSAAAVEAGLSGGEEAKSDTLKREEPEAQRREHPFASDGATNYRGRGSGRDSGDLLPPSGGNEFINRNGDEIFTVSENSRLSDSYGAPIPSNAYGLPHSGFGNPKPSNSYGPPPPKSIFRPPKNKYLPPPKSRYGPPFAGFPSLPKPVYGPPSPPNLAYGPPKPNFSSRPKPVYGPPKFSLGTPLSLIDNVKSQYGPPKVGTAYGTPLQPSSSYGPPKNSDFPPTPPEVKFDGWKPIPGLVSDGPASNTHGASHLTTGGGGSYFGGFSSGGSGGFGSSDSHNSHKTSSFAETSFGISSLGTGLVPSNSYGAPSRPRPSYGTPLAPSVSYGSPGGFGSDSLKDGFLSSARAPSSSYGPPGLVFSRFPPKPNFSHSRRPSGPHGAPRRPGGSYGPPKPPGSFFNPLKSPSNSYGAPKPPSFSYGPPKPTATHRPAKFPSVSHGPPRPPGISYGTPGSVSGSYNSAKPPSHSYGPPTAPGNSFGPPKPPGSSYGPPKPPSSHAPVPIADSYGPPPPRPLTDSYGPPTSTGVSLDPSSVFTSYKIPKLSVSVDAAALSTAYRGPPVPHPLRPPPSGAGPASFSEGLYKAPLSADALYGVPPAPVALTAVDCCGPASQGAGLGNSYGVVPIPDVPLPIASPLSPPSVTPYQAYGPPTAPSTPASVINSHDAPALSTGLPFNQPRKPVKFRPPVPVGLISSIGAKWGDSAAWGGNVHSHRFHGNAYIPPAVPDPDPGVHGNKGNPLIIPPPTAPPVHYGAPTTPAIQYGVPVGTGTQLHSEHRHKAAGHVESSNSLNAIEGVLNPPPPVPDIQTTPDAQPSLPIESSDVNLHPPIDVRNNFQSSGTPYNAPPPPGDHSDHSSAYNSVSSAGRGLDGGSQTIPIKGSRGRYTLQIQSASGNKGEHVAHGEVLSNGLLQDILAAIENPSESIKLQQYRGQQISDPVANEIGMSVLKQLGSTFIGESQSLRPSTQYGRDLAQASSNDVPEYSNDNNDVIRISSTDGIDEGSPRNLTRSEGKIAEYLSSNKIAFYYNDRETDERSNSPREILLVPTVADSSTSPVPVTNRHESSASVTSENAQRNFTAYFEPTVRPDRNSVS